MFWVFNVHFAKCFECIMLLAHNVRVCRFLDSKLRFPRILTKFFLIVTPSNDGPMLDRKLSVGPRSTDNKSSKQIQKIQQIQQIKQIQQIHQI